MSDEPLLDAATLRQLERLSLAQLGAVLAGLAGRHPGASSARGGEYADHRPYAPGDDLRRIDWNAYARLRQAVVRLAADEAAVGLAVLVDASASMDGAALRAAKRVSALLGAVALLRADVTQIVTVADGDAGRGLRMAGPHELWTLVAELEAVRAHGSTALAAGLCAWSAAGDPPALAVLVTDALVDDAALDEAIAELADGARAAAVAHVVDDGERRAAAEPGGVELVDRETGRRVTVAGGAAAAERYARRVEALAERVAARCADHGVEYARVGTDEDPMDLLARLAGARVLATGT